MSPDGTRAADANAGNGDGRGEYRGHATSDDGRSATTDTERALAALARLSTDELLDARRVCAVLGFPPAAAEPDLALEPRGYRLLHRLPRFPDALVDRVVDHFLGLQGIMRASVGELEEVDGVGEARARSLKEGLARLAEASILDRYS